MLFQDPCINNLNKSQGTVRAIVPKTKEKSLETSTGEHRCTKSTAPTCRPIKSMQDRKDFQNLIKELEDKKIIERSKFQWLNPVVFLREKNGNLRSCLDFRKLNDLGGKIRRPCRVTKSVCRDSIFEESCLSFEKVMLVVYLWTADYRQKEIINESRVNCKAVSEWRT
ncbi:hypothetical protein P3W45_001751 [Vairimorpha bombi]